MTPAARLQAAIGITDRWLAGEGLLDRLLTLWGRESRYAGSGDRRAVADLVYDAVRRLRSAAWAAGVEEPADGRATLLGSLVLDGIGPADRDSLFSGVGYGPEPLSGTEASRLGRSIDAAPAAVRLDLPDWLLAHLDHVPEGALALLRQKAQVFLRVNALKTEPAGAIEALGAEGIAAVPGPLSASCLRVTVGAPAVARSRAYLDGLVEVQDAASQAAAEYADPRPGEIVLDYCAGGGGKSLAFAARMGATGHLHAHDISERRLSQLPDRAERAGATVTLCPPDRVSGLDGRCDLVFVDAPCSGSGAWRRNPDAKWRLTAAELSSLNATQDSVLADAAAAVRPGGRLVYATCSMIPAENEVRVDAFLEARPDFRAGRAPLVLTPLDGGDGFFAAELVRAG